jgi:fibronectin-binding autotransporter adhesin
MKANEMFLTLLGLGVAISASAQTWNGDGGDDNWTTDLNWGGTAPSANDLLTFSGTTRITNNNDFAAGTQFNGITLNLNTGPWTLNGNAINLAGGILVSANSSSLRTHILNMDLALQNPSTLITTRGNDNITLNGLISGNTDIHKAAAGTLRFTNNANTWTGNLQIDSGGTVEVTSIANAGVASAAGAGSTISFAHANATLRAQLALSGATTAQSTNRQILIGPSSDSTATHDAGIRNLSSGTLTFTNATFNLAQAGATGTATRTLTLNGSNTGANTIQGVIQDNSATNRVRLIKGEAGTWVLEGNNTYSGGTEIRLGTLRVGNNVGNLGTQALTLDGGTLEVTTNGNFNPTATGTGAAGRGLIISSSGGTLNVTDAAGNLQLTGVVSGTGTLNVTGVGRVTPSNQNNTFSGNINISGGATVSVATSVIGDKGSNARLGSGANLNMDNGILNFSGSVGGVENTHTRNTVLGAGGGTIVLGNANNHNPTITWNGNISGVGNLTVANSGGTSGHLILGGANSHAGNTIVNTGSTLTLANGGSLSFNIGANGINNSLSGAGDLVLNGALLFDLSGASLSVGDSWTIVSSALLAKTTFGGSFSVTNFTDQGDGTWLSNNPHYQFDTSTGILSVIPEPGTYTLIGGLLALGAVLIRRRIK